MAGGMKGSAPLLSPGWWPGNLIRPRQEQFLHSFSRWSDSQLGGSPKVAMMTGEDLPQGVGHIVQEMPAICGLDGRGGALADAIGVGAGTVAGDDLDARMGFQPCGNGVGLTVRQKVDGAVTFEIDDDGAVTLAPASCPVIDPDDPRCRDRHHGHRADQAQQCVATDRYSEPGGQPGARISASTQCNGALRLGKPPGAPDPRGRHRGQRLGEDAAGTVRRRTPEAANLQVEFANPALPRQVAQMSGVPTVDGCGGATAQRTVRLCGPHVGRDGYAISVDRNPVDDKAGWEQRKQ